VTVVTDVEGLLRLHLDELDEEQKNLRSALNHLSGTNPRKRPTKPRGSRSQPHMTSVTSGKRRRSRKGGTRREHALAFIKKHPGTTATQVADELNIAPSYVYRVLGDLKKDGKVRKDGTAYWPS
jgi:predicted HTH transcriptional regulator